MKNNSKVYLIIWLGLLLISCTKNSNESSSINSDPTVFTTKNTISTPTSTISTELNNSLQIDNLQSTIINTPNSIIPCNDNVIDPKEMIITIDFGNNAYAQNLNSGYTCIIQFHQQISIIKRVLPNNRFIVEGDGYFFYSTYSGENLDTIFKFSSVEGGNEGIYYNFDLSPQLEYVSYKIGTGEYYENTEFPDYSYFEKVILYIASIEKPEIHWKISSFGNVRDTSWSPNGQYIAYLDYKNGEIPYTVLYDVKNRKTIESIILDKSVEFSGFVWSPDNSYLGINYFELNHDVALLLLNIKEDTQQICEDTNLYWWIDNDRYLFGNDINKGQKIHLYNINAKVDRLLEDNGKEIWYQGGPFQNSQKMGHYNASGMFEVYDINTQKFTIYPKITEGLILSNYWLSFPSDDTLIE
jgi:hypothetical protein